MVLCIAIIDLAALGRSASSGRLRVYESTPE
jgi:hypothetical protein